MKNFRKLYLEIGEKNIEHALLDGDDMCFLPFFQSCVAEEYYNVLDTLDRGIIDKDVD